MSCSAITAAAAAGWSCDLHTESATTPLAQRRTGQPARCQQEMWQLCSWLTRSWGPLCLTGADSPRAEAHPYCAGEGRQQAGSRKRGAAHVAAQLPPKRQIRGTSRLAGAHREPPSGSSVEDEDLLPEALHRLVEASQGSGDGDR